MAQWSARKHLKPSLACGFVVTLAIGCGQAPEYEGLDQQSTAAQQQARTNAYGNANNPAAKKVTGKAGLSPEAQARARSGR